MRLRRFALSALIVVPMAFNAILLWPEVSIPTPNVNDDAEHLAFVVRADDALRSGENVIDHWLPDIDLGFPEFFYYQHLPHLAVVAVHRITFGLLDLVTAFNLVRWLLLVTFPLTVFWATRHMGSGDLAAAISAAAAGLLSADHRYGFEYDSYVWRGFGLYTQIWAMHLSFIVLACMYRLLAQGRGLVRTIIVVAALSLSHLIYAYMMAISTMVLFAAAMTKAMVREQLLRLAVVAVAVLALTSYMWVPFVLQTAYLSTSPNLQPEKFESYGAATVLTWLLTGELFDHGRLPIFTFLAGSGVAASMLDRRRLGLFAVSLLAVWLWLYSGRAAIGPLFNLLPLHDGLLFHRFIGGVDIAGIVLIGLGGSAIWNWLSTGRVAAALDRIPRWRLVAAAIASILLLGPALSERSAYYGSQATWLRQTNEAIARDADLRTILDTIRRSPPGRVYAGLTSNWGRTLDFGLPFNSVHVYQLLTTEGFATVAPPFGGQSLNSDLQFNFDDQRLSQYDLYNVRYVIASPGVSFPGFLTRRAVTSRYVLYEAPSSGYAELVSITGTQVFGTQKTLFPAMRAFANGTGPDALEYVRFDFPAQLDTTAGATVNGCASGATSSNELVHPAQLSVDLTCIGPSPAIFKVTFHPDWVVTVDGVSVPTFMASPSYLGFMLPAGSHRVVAEYRSSPLKAPLLVLGSLTLVCLAVLRRRDAVAFLRLRWRDRSAEPQRSRSDAD